MKADIDCLTHGMGRGGETEGLPGTVQRRIDER